MMTVFMEEQSLKMILIKFAVIFLNKYFVGKTSIDKALIEQPKLEPLIQLFDNETVGNVFL